MKTKKIVIGTMAAAMLSLSVCSLIPTAAANDTVQIIASSTEAKAGEKFTVEVSLADIPAAGVQGCNFSINFDKSVITIDEITAGSLATGAGSGDPSSSMLPNFNTFYKNDEGYASVMWSTSVDDSTYWLKDKGVFCTISGTVAAGAKAGAKSAIEIVPVKRPVTSGSTVMNTEIDCGSFVNGERVAYTVSTKAGSVTVKGNEVTTVEYTEPSTKEPTTSNVEPGKGKKGDANEDGKVTMADATAVLQHIGNTEKYGLSAQGVINGDVDGTPGLTGEDASLIQMYDAKLITSFD